MFRLAPLLLDTSQVHCLDDLCDGRSLPSNALAEESGRAVGLNGMAERLRLFLTVESQHRQARRSRALGFGVAASGLSLLIFLIVNQMFFAPSILAAGLACVLISGLVGAGAAVRMKRLAVSRHELAREFYRIGLRVKGGTLLTNNAHPQVLAVC